MESRIFRPGDTDFCDRDPVREGCAQIFDSTGTAVTDVVFVTDKTEGVDYLDDIVALTSGGSAAVWPGPESNGAHCRLFDPDAEAGGRQTMVPGSALRDRTFWGPLPTLSKTRACP